jgi:hypothetical protein
MKHNQFLGIFVIALVAAVVGATSLSSAQETVATNTGTLTFAEAPSGEGPIGASPSTATADDRWHFVVAAYL